jgi:hypothetical protein
MPIHDWTRVPPGLFHDFHQSWSIRIKEAMNAGLMPRNLCALVEQRSSPKESVYSKTAEIYAARANRIVIKHQLRRIVSVIEVLAPGNKNSRAAIHDFVQRILAFLRVGVHVLLIDLFPPTPRDPVGMHQLIWDEIRGDAFEFPLGKDRLLVSYETGDEKAAYLEMIAVGDLLPEMPLFVGEAKYVNVPLEPTYQAAWLTCLEVMRRAVETGVMPDLEED